jgi:hypothetical protein
MRLYENFTYDMLTVDEAILLRPSDIDKISRHTVGWIIDHPQLRAQCQALADELARGAKAAVVHFATAAGLY